MHRELICIVCPIGCALQVDENEEGLVVTGNKCKRGKDYAIEECHHPTRTLTTTAKVTGGVLPVIPVKSEKPIPKGLLMEAMDLINTKVLQAPVTIGQVVVENVLDTGVDIVTTRECDSMSSHV